MTEKNTFREKFLSQSKLQSSLLCSSSSSLSGKSSISSFSSEFSQLSHEHISVQTKLFLKHRHLPSTQPPLQPQKLSSITDSGAGRFVVITGSHIKNLHCSMSIQKDLDLVDMDLICVMTSIARRCNAREVFSVQMLSL